MATFYLIDHSLKKAGGHHFDYAVRVLEVAEQRGFDIVLATHRKFRQRDVLPPSWQVVSPFRHHAYCKYCTHNGWDQGAIGLDGELLPPQGNEFAGRGGWQQRRGVRDRARRIDRFATACDIVFREARLSSTDHVFVPTLTEFDLLGLVKYLRSDPSTEHAAWHLQFHFGIFTGRDPDYASQSGRVFPLRRQFEAALSCVPDHHLHFYATTPQLARQYDRLDIASFDPLPYPINDACHPPRDREVQQPLRVTSAGAVRGEKGQQHYSSLLQELWADAFSTGKLQLALQCKRKRLSKQPRQIVTAPELIDDENIYHAPHERPLLPIVRIRHPLAPSDYISLIHHTDIGLLMYDSATYFARHAGVLGEYLSAGVPVIVPAGCWLAEQINHEIQSHLAELTQSAACRQLELSAITWDGLPTRTITSDQRLACTFRRPVSTADLLIRFDTVEPLASGVYIEVLAEQFDSQQQLIATSKSIVSPGDSSRTMHACFPAVANTEHCWITWSNAYDHSNIAIAGVRIHSIDGEPSAAGSVPAGRVGLIAADSQQVAALLRNVERHYDHYRDSARAFSRSWHDAHRPQRTLERLLTASRANSSQDATRAA